MYLRASLAFVVDAALALAESEWAEVLVDARDWAGARLANAAVWYLRERVLTCDEERVDLDLLLSGRLNEECVAAHAEAFDAGQQCLARDIRAAITNDKNIHPGYDKFRALLEEIIAIPPLAQKPVEHAADDVRQRLGAVLLEAVLLDPVAPVDARVSHYLDHVSAFVDSLIRR